MDDRLAESQLQFHSAGTDAADAMVASKEAEVPQKSKETVFEEVTQDTWQIFAICAAVVFCLLGLLYMLRVVMYPRKVCFPDPDSWMILPLGNLVAALALPIVDIKYHEVRMVFACCCA